MSHKHSKKHLDHLTVKITVDEVDNGTNATARMTWEDGELIGKGRTPPPPRAPSPERVGRNRASAGALRDLEEMVYAATASDIESVTGERVSVR